MVRGWATALAAALLVAGTGGAGLAQTRSVADAPDPYLHKGTAMRFPARVGDFRRTQVNEYNADGSDASAGYDLIRGGAKLMTVTVYLYPIARDAGPRDAACRAEMEGIGEAIRTSESYADVVLHDQGEAGAPTPRLATTGLRASHRLVAPFDGKRTAVRSDTYLYCPGAGHWFVQYRATWPDGADRESDLIALMAAMPWSDGISR